MACGKKNIQNPAEAAQFRRDFIARLFAKGKVIQAAHHRINQCLHASECGRLCRWLVKGPGIELVDCCHPGLPKRIKLYPALEDASFVCPDEKF